jgi:ABC-type multidrug transport system fused ATPase/permease subunit
MAKLALFQPQSPSHKEKVEEIINKGNSDVELGSVAMESGTIAGAETGNQIASTQQPLPFLLAFTDLYYSVKKPKKLAFLCSLSPGNRLASDTATSTGNLSRTKVLLNNISGEAREGEIFAILGASGSGNIKQFYFCSTCWGFYFICSS